MKEPASVALPITDSSQIGEARREINRLARESGVSADDCSRLNLIVTELATNLVKHAKRGELIARSLVNESRPGLALYSIDRGPGMRNLDQCQQDGFSTTGSSGTGLGALRRQADSLQIYSLDQIGTIIALTVGAGKAPWPATETGIITAPAPGESVCGDACTLVHTSDYTVAVMADGLGHGLHAADAANEALRTAHQHASANPAELMHFLHAALRKTRGAAVSIARIDHASRQISFCNVGNISTLLVNFAKAKTIATGNGIVGHILPRVETLTLPWTGNDLLVMHSDGIHAQDRVFNQPGLLLRPAPLIAGMIYAQQKRGRDDASVLVLRSLKS